MATHMSLFKMKNTTQYSQHRASRNEQAGVQMGLFTIALQWYSHSGCKRVKFSCNSSASLFGEMATDVGGEIELKENFWEQMS